MGKWDFRENGLLEPVRPSQKNFENGILGKFPAKNMEYIPVSIIYILL